MFASRSTKQRSFSIYQRILWSIQGLRCTAKTAFVSIHHITRSSVVARNTFECYPLQSRRCCRCSRKNVTFSSICFWPYFIAYFFSRVDHGFQGVIKRHGFKGMPASHGVTKTHRRPGNIGAGGGKARVWPGTRMPGHMGNRWRNLRGLKIWRINTKYNVMWVQGSNIAGDTNGLVYIYDTILPLRKYKESPAFPTHFESENDLYADEDMWQEEIHNFKGGSITFKEE